MNAGKRRVVEEDMKEKEAEVRLHILGARGSVPTDGEEYRIFGGATSCVYLEWNDARIILDAGSGLLRLKDQNMERALPWYLFLSHYHSDHLLGLPMWKPMYDRRFKLTVCGADFQMPPKNAIDALMREPLWPVGEEAFLANIAFRQLSGAFPLAGGGPVAECMRAKHPGGVALYRFSGGNKRVVYATDCELDDKSEKELKEFAKNADIIILDAQYLPQEYTKFRGFGHNAIARACRLLNELGPGIGLLFHHAPEHEDELLLSLEREYRQNNENADIRFARAGEVITL